MADKTTSCLGVADVRTFAEAIGSRTGYADVVPTLGIHNEKAGLPSLSCTCTCTIYPIVAPVAMTSAIAITTECRKLIRLFVERPLLRVPYVSIQLTMRVFRVRGSWKSWIKIESGSC